MPRRAIRLDPSRHLGGGARRKRYQQNPPAIGAVDDMCATRCANVFVLLDPARLLLSGLASLP